MNIFIPLYLSLISRVCGSPYKWFGLPLYTLPYAFLTDNIFLGVLVVAWVMFFKIAGHADGFKDYVRDNSLSKAIVIPLSKYLNIERDSIQYDALFWFIKGGLITLLPAILVGSLPLFLFSAIGYPLAYYLGFNKLKGDPLVWGESLAGFFAGLAFLF